MSNHTRPTQSQLQAMSNAELLHNLIFDTTNGHVYRPEITRRIGLHRLILDCLNTGQRFGPDEEIKRPQDASPPPLQDRQVLVEKLRVLAKYPERYVEFYETLLALGWQGEGMKSDQEGALGYMRANIAINDPWEELIPNAQSFYKAVRFAALAHRW
jgi:hypothetical protein